MILLSNMTWLNDLTKSWSFEVECPKTATRHDYTSRHIRIHTQDGEKWSSPTSFNRPNLLRHHVNGNRVDRLCVGTVVAATGSLAVMERRLWSGDHVQNKTNKHSERKLPPARHKTKSSSKGLKYHGHIQNMFYSQFYPCMMCEKCYVEHPRRFADSLICESH